MMRRLLATLLVVVFVVGSVAAGGQSEAPPSESMGEVPAEYANSDIDWRQASGETIVFGGLEHPWMTAVRPLLPQFTELTGIEVVPEVSSETEYVSKMPITLSGGSATPDVFMVWAYGQAVTGGWLEPLGPYFQNEELTDLDWYNMDDIFQSARDFPVWPEDERQYAVAITAEAQTVFMNEELLNEAGMDAPETMSELYDLAVELDGEQRSGIAMRAKPTGDAVPWTAGGFIFSYGGEIIDSEGRAAFDSPEAVAAVEMYAQLLRDAGPVGVGTYHWYEALNDYMQGRTAISIDSSNFALDIEDPDQSRQAGNTLYGALPRSDRGSAKPNMWYWLLGMNSASENKTAAWLFIQWLTSEPTSIQIANNRATPPRISAWQDPGFRDVFGDQAAEAALQNLQNADANVMTRAWFNPNSPEVLDLLAIAINEVITGSASAEDALTRAAAEANAVLDE